MTKKNLKYKARIPWNKDKKLTKKHKRNISKGRKGIPAWNKEIPRRPEVKKKISASRKRKGYIPWNKDKRLSEEHKRNISKGRKGIPAWNKGLRWSKEVKRKIAKTIKKQYRA